MNNNNNKKTMDKKDLSVPTKSLACMPSAQKN